ncbi:hypothetical protein SAMN05877838_1139 [Hoeflea halophila]|uniref:Uncharacterized protein n=1 Tax=Hoeflea halophila TaxID=714899 RepID=A0A286I824_9HYPH|nr:hypothetical protein [Hoeflea halophila]SOE16278.1 hypothetical protein SAMN05877838_1139 [Hoeflea halophila]
MRLTAIIPLLGVVLIFNDNTSKIFSLAPYFLEDIGQLNGNQFSLNTLYFTYFGLCSLGFGSIIFSLACPSDIQTQPNQLEYVSSTPIGDSKNLAKSHLRYVVQAFAKAHEYDFDREDYRANYSYPDTLIGEMNGLLEELYNAAESADIAESDESAEVGATPDGSAEVEYEDIPDFMEVMNGAGYYDFTKYGIAMANEVRINWVYTVPFYGQAPNFSRDIAYIKYQTDEYSRFSARMLTLIFYIFGLIILSIPTVQTFYLLSVNVLYRAL